jgi:hypothetical protein
MTTPAERELKDFAEWNTRITTYISDGDYDGARLYLKQRPSIYSSILLSRVERAYRESVVDPAQRGTVEKCDLPLVNATITSKVTTTNK